jgi:transmembrane sensor
MKKDVLADLLKKYLAGDCSAEEIAVVNEWYEASNAQPDHLASLSEDQNELIRQRMLRAILKDAELAETAVKPVSSVRTLFSGNWAKLLAAAVLLFLIKTAVQQIYTYSPAGNTSTVKERHIVNQTNTIYKQVLPDNSVVWLSPQSTLTFPEKFAAKSRNVKMSGGCYFEVTKNPQRPFIIQSGRVVTKVWGTSFKIDDSNSSIATVTVVTGKVSVRRNNRSEENISPVMGADEVLLLPHQKVTYQQRSNTLQTSKVTETASLQLYQHVNLSFTNIKLSQIVQVLSKTYKSDIKIDSTINGNMLMNADFNGLNLPEVLETLQTSLKVSYAIQNETITLIK